MSVFSSYPSIIIRSETSREAVILTVCPAPVARCPGVRQCHCSVWASHGCGYVCDHSSGSDDVGLPDVLIIPRNCFDLPILTNGDTSIRTRDVDFCNTLSHNRIIPNCSRRHINRFDLFTSCNHSIQHHLPVTLSLSRNMPKITWLWRNW